MSIVDKAASISFAVFVVLESGLDGTDDDMKWRARLTWLILAVATVLVAHATEKPHKALLKPTNEDEVTSLTNSVASRVEPAQNGVSDVEQPTGADTTIPIPQSPATISKEDANASGLLSPLSFDSTLSDSASIKTKRSGLFKRTTKALFSPIRRTSRSLKSPANKNPGEASPNTAEQTSALTEQAETSVQVSAGLVELNVSAITENVSGVTGTPQVVNPEAKAVPKDELDEFGFGPAAKPPPFDFVYVNTNTWGYLGYLDDKQTKALDEMRAKGYSCKESLGDSPAFPINDETLLRFLRARKFDVNKAERMFEAHLKWRDTFIPSKLTPNDIASVLGTGLTRFGPYSKLGLPSTIIKVEFFEPSKFDEIDLFTKYVAFFFERALKLLPRGADKGILFFDMKGWSLRKHATRHSMRLTAELINIIQAHNPERLDKCILFNTPLIFSGTWAIIKGLLDPVVAHKVMFVSDTSVMLDLFEKETLPIEYGGIRTLPYPIEGFAELHTAVKT